MARVTKLMMQVQIDFLQADVHDLRWQLEMARSERDIYKQVSQRTDTALISAQRISEASAKLCDSAVDIISRRTT